MLLRDRPVRNNQSCPAAIFITSCCAALTNTLTHSHLATASRGGGGDGDGLKVRQWNVNEVDVLGSGDGDGGKARRHKKTIPIHCGDAYELEKEHGLGWLEAVTGRLR